MDVLEPEEELMKDVLQIMNVYVSKMNGYHLFSIKMYKQHHMIVIK